MDASLSKTLSNTGLPIGYVSCFVSDSTRISLTSCIFRWDGLNYQITPVPPVSSQTNNQRKIRPSLDQTTNRGTEVHANSMFEHLGYSPHPLTSSLCDLLEGSETAIRNRNEKYAANTPTFGNTRLWRLKRTLKRHWSMDAGIDTTSSRVRQQLLSEFIRILGNLIYQAVKAEQMNTSVLGSQDLKQVDLESLSTGLKHKLAAYVFDELDLNRDELIDFREMELFLQFYELLP
ncbi:hypothetical protein CSKR_108235 [Clonorchis sinensis]|uniref:Uncharacterized protein n=1 Tax=Clonorchis sinensis TaxID=79923 RepID=A0A3R7EVR9_CLOSI|nr:hypothetical protein CSKR_108235 [Clonorchis sinensis]